MALSKIEQRARRRARARVLQAVYAWEMGGVGTIASTADRLWDDVSLGADERAFATPLVNTLGAQLPSIDEALTDAAANWRLERIGAIERAILRVATAELIRNEHPPRVTLQEAVLLAERYGSAESAKFVNGILDAVARRLGRV